MSNERIDVTELEKRFEDGLNWDDSDTMDLITELKQCYEREDIATEALLENAEMMREYVGQIIDLKRNIRDMIDACEGVDTLFGEEVVGMLQELLA